MSTSNQTYKELSIPYFKEVFDCIDEIMIRHGIPYYLIGVTAIALQLLKKGIKPSRGTKDIDFAIMISSIQEYEKLSYSLDQKGFNKVSARWTFYSEEFNVAIDILPFGEIEEQNTMRFNERHSDLHLLGFKEVLQQSEKVRIEEKVVNIPPLPGMIVLKLVAWSDRPEERENDLVDILRIIEHYFNFNFDEIVEHHNDTFPERDDEFDQIIIAAEVLGRMAKTYLARSEVLSDRIYSVLETNLTRESESKIARVWASRNDWNIEYAASILKAFLKGVEHEL